MDVLTDEELVQRCKVELPHTTRSYEELVARHAQKVYSLVYRVVDDRQEAEDISQEVFLKVYHGLPKFDQRALFSTWLYRIATNSALDALDKERRHRHHTVRVDMRPTAQDETRENDALASLAAPEANPEELSLRGELRACINRVLQQLDREQARVLLLRDFENLSYDEIAKMVQTGLSAVKMRIYRARLAFRDLFNQLCGSAYLTISLSSATQDKGKTTKKE